MQTEQQANPLKRDLQIIDTAVKSLRGHGDPLTTSNLRTQAVIADALAPVFAELPMVRRYRDGHTRLRVRGMTGLRFPRALSDLSPETRVARNVTVMMLGGEVVRLDSHGNWPEGSKLVRVAELYTCRKTDAIVKVVLANEQD